MAECRLLSSFGLESSRAFFPHVLCQGQSAAACLARMAEIGGSYPSTSTPQAHFKRPQIPSHRDHKALNRGTLGAPGKGPSISIVHTSTPKSGCGNQLKQVYTICLHGLLRFTAHGIHAAHGLGYLRCSAYRNHAGFQPSAAFRAFTTTCAKKSQYNSNGIQRCCHPDCGFETCVVCSYFFKCSYLCT